MPKTSRKGEQPRTKSTEARIKQLNEATVQNFLVPTTLESHVLQFHPNYEKNVRNYLISTQAEITKPIPVSSEIAKTIEEQRLFLQNGGDIYSPEFSELEQRDPRKLLVAFDLEHCVGEPRDEEIASKGHSKKFLFRRSFFRTVSSLNQMGIKVGIWTTLAHDRVKNILADFPGAENMFDIIVCYENFLRNISENLIQAERNAVPISYLGMRNNDNEFSAFGGKFFYKLPKPTVLIDDNLRDVCYITKTTKLRIPRIVGLRNSNKTQTPISGAIYEESYPLSLLSDDVPRFITRTPASNPINSKLLIEEILWHFKMLQKTKK